MTTTITWNGEDEFHPGGNGPRFMKWKGVAFELGKGVETDDPYMIGKAKNNRFFTVSGEEEPEPEQHKRGPGRPRKVEKDD